MEKKPIRTIFERILYNLIYYKIISVVKQRVMKYLEKSLIVKRKTKKQKAPHGEEPDPFILIKEHLTSACKHTSIRFYYSQLALS